MKVLLHICCAPCSVMCIEALRAERYEPVGFWYNPNIHPYTEYTARRDTLKRYAKDIGLETVFDDEYGLRRFLSATVDDMDHRCGKCYAMRLDRAASYAAGHGFPAFSTTLLISPYQNHELIKRIGEKCAAKYGIEFLYRDFRPFFAEGQLRARELKFYMQKYCGCIFSEESRYLQPTPKPSGIPDGCEFPNRRAVQVKRAESAAAVAELFRGDCVFSVGGEDGLPDGADAFVLKVNEEIAAAAVVTDDSGYPELEFLAARGAFRGKGFEESLLKQLCGNYGQKHSRMVVGASADKIPFFVKQGFDRYEKTAVVNTDSGSRETHYYSKDLKAGRKPD